MYVIVLLKNSLKIDPGKEVTSVSKKSGQTTVVIQNYRLSRFFWNRRYVYQKLHTITYKSRLTQKKLHK